MLKFVVLLQLILGKLKNIKQEIETLFYISQFYDELHDEHQYS